MKFDFVKEVLKMPKKKLQLKIGESYKFKPEDYKLYFTHEYLDKVNQVIWLR